MSQEICNQKMNFGKLFVKASKLKKILKLTSVDSRLLQVFRAGVPNLLSLKPTKLNSGASGAMVL